MLYTIKPTLLILVALLFVISAEGGQVRRRLTHNTPENCIKKCNNRCSSTSRFCSNDKDCRTGCLFGDLVVGGCGDEVGSLFSNGKGCQDEPTTVTDFKILTKCDRECGKDNSNFEACHEGCLFFHQILSPDAEFQGGTTRDTVFSFAHVSCQAVCLESDDESSCQKGCDIFNDRGSTPSSINDSGPVDACKAQCANTNKDVDFCGQGCQAMNDMSIGEFSVLALTDVGSGENPQKPPDNPDPVVDENSDAGPGVPDDETEPPVDPNEGEDETEQDAQNIDPIAIIAGGSVAGAMVLLAATVYVRNNNAKNQINASHHQRTQDVGFSGQSAANPRFSTV